MAGRLGSCRTGRGLPDSPVAVPRLRGRREPLRGLLGGVVEDVDLGEAEKESPRHVGVVVMPRSLATVRPRAYSTETDIGIR